MIFCSNCGNKLVQTSKFCTSCGVGVASSSYDSTEQNTSSSPLSNTETPPQHKSSVLSSVETKKISKKKKILVGVLCFIILYTFYIAFSAIPTSSNEQPNTASASASPINYIKTTATQMINTYKNNEVKADRIFKNNYIEIKGKVSSIDSDISDEAVIHLSSKNEYEFSTVIAKGDKNFQEKAINLDKGQIVTLKCIGGGEVIGSPVLNECKIQ